MVTAARYLNRELVLVLVSVTALVRTAAGVVTFMVLPGVLLLAAWPVAVATESLDRPYRWLAVAVGLSLVGAYAMRDAAYLAAKPTVCRSGRCVWPARCRP